MVRIIEHRAEAAGEEFVEFHVYSKPSDSSVTVAYYHEPVSGGRRWRKSGMDLPVDEAFRDAVRIASERHIPFLWVNDPHGLFPPERRPSVS